MAGMFMQGETKVRPGTYFNVQKQDDNPIIGGINGSVAVIFRSDWGPLNEAVELDCDEGYEHIYGTGLTTDAIKYAFQGGAVKAICCRVGNGGTSAQVQLKDASNTEAVVIKGKYAGAKPFSVSIKDKLADETKRECVIYTGTKEFEKVEFEKGGDEVAALVKALSTSPNFTAEKSGSVSGPLAAVVQADFTPGTNPVTTVDDYATGFSAVEMYSFNTICVDTEDQNIHGLLESFVDRIFQTGQLTQAVVAEKKSVSLNDRMAHAAAFNSERVIYVLNSAVTSGGAAIEGYQTAAQIAGMVAAVPAERSLTHTVLDGVTELNEKLTNAQVIKAETMGCLVFSLNNHKQVWIDSAINTLITPADNQDDGWKKIRRTKTRYELVTRACNQADALIGKVDNDLNGRSTIISQIQGVGDAMVAEKKLISCKVSESRQYKADGDAAWFDLEVVDKDSAEKIYLTYAFRFNTYE